MERCELYQALLLEYLYDLLEGHERQSLETHLTACAGCRAALETAKHQQQLLAAAAKAEFAGVHFQAPAVGEIAPATIPIPVAVRKARPSFRRWALAAAAVVLAVGLGGSGLWVSNDYATAKQGVEEGKFAIASQEKEKRQIETELREWPQQRDVALRKVVEEVNRQQFWVEVVGPKTIQPGAPNEYVVATTDLNDQPTPTRVLAFVKDQQGREIYKKDLETPADKHRIELPPTIPVQPNSQLKLEIVARKDDVRSELTQQLDLVAPVYVTHLATDKPMYQPGETVRFRSLTLERFSLKPPEQPLNLVYTLIQPSGAQVQLGMGASSISRADPKTGTIAPIVGPDKKPVQGIGAGEFFVDAGMPGGEYTLRVSEMANRFPPQDRKFLVNQYQAHKLDTKLDFSKKSYGPREDVSAACEAKRAGGGGEVANRPVYAMVKVDGVQYGADGKPSNQPIQFRTDAKGKVPVRFKLPAAIPTGIGTVSVTFDDGANTDTMVKPIPIVLKKLDVQFFPEGGDLVAGLENRVYFQVRNTLGKPADLEGHIVDAAKKTVVDSVQTLTDAEQPGVNQGLGMFKLTPTAGSKYELKIDSPAGMEGVYPLPEVKDEGVVLSIPKGVTTAKEPIGVFVSNIGAERKLLVGAYCRGRLLDHTSIILRKNESVQVRLNPTVGAGGVYRVTVFEERDNGKQRNLIPVAERLVYRQPAEQLLLTAKHDKNVYVPGDKVSLKISSLNEQEKPAPAILMVGVVNQSIVTMADEKTRRSMPTHFLMTSEVKKPEDLEYADFLVGSHEKAGAALDLLLGTQGWRRFAEQNPIKFKKDQADEADRLLFYSGLSQRPVDLEREQLQNVVKEMTAKQTHLEEELRQANERLQSSRTDLAISAVLRKMQNYDEWFRTGRQLAIPLICLMLLVVTITTLIAGLMRKISRAIPLLVTSAACAAVACVLFVNYTQDKRDGPGQVAVNYSKSMGEAAAKMKAEEVLARARDVAEKADAMPPGPDETPLDALNEAKLGEAPAMPAREEQAGARALDRPRPQAQEGAKPGAAGDAGKDKDKAENKFHLGAKNAKQNKEVELFMKGADGKGEARAGGEAMPAGKPGQAGAFGGNNQAINRGIGGPGVGMQGGFGGLQGNNQGNNQGGLGGLQGGFAPQMPAGGMAKGGLIPAPPAAPPAAANGAFDRKAAQDGARAFGRPEKQEALKLRRALRDMDAEKSIALPPIVVREYAHFRTHGAEADRRTDATETVYWNPVLVLADGKGEATFDLSDQVTSYEVTAYGHTLDGRLGALTSTIEARIPLALEAKVPFEVTANDKIDLPLAIANNTDKAQTVQVGATYSGLTLLGVNEPVRFQLAADARTRRIYRLQPSIVEGEAEVDFTSSDKIRRTIRVVPDGFPILASKSDLLEKSATSEIVLPETWIKGTLKAQVSVYPSTLADLQKGLDALLREPNGCFEQTSTSNYPNLLILDYLKESDQTKPELEKRARDLLARGYQKLTAFECPKTGEKDRTGFEWFGQTDQQHEALTAYGLLQFRDMSRVMDVDPNLIQRTRGFLLAQRDGKGGFKRNPRALDTFGRAPENVTNAYIVWAITGSGKDDDVTTELEALSGQAKESKDPYFLALVANSLINSGKTGEAMELLKKLAGAQQADGHLDAQQTSITGSAGRDLQIETTALTVLAWLKGNPGEFNANVRKAVTWIGQQRGGYGGFGSTQSTILALKALIEFTKANKKTPEAGTLSLFVGDKLVGKLDFPADAREALEIKLPNAEEVLKPGKNAVRVEITGQNVLPYTLSWSYQTLKPASDPDCPVHLTTSLDRTKAGEGDTVTLNVTVENPSDAERSMVVAIVGLPAGLTLPEDMKQLKEHARPRDEGTKPGRISYFETRGRELILYWRGMGPKQKIEVPVELVCRVPGEYRGPASRAYMYYNADHKHWVEPLAVTITPKSE
jgi:hypothetical protein